MILDNYDDVLKESLCTYKNGKIGKNLDIGHQCWKVTDAALPNIRHHLRRRTRRIQGERKRRNEGENVPLQANGVT